MVDGPPGTGKSYTIMAISYWATQKNKSIMVTSHKKAALDVVEHLMTEKFRKLHPKRKPSILRISRDDIGANNYQFTLSDTVISTSTDEANNYNDEAINKDQDYWYKKIEKQNSDFWNNAESYPQYISKLLELEKIEKEYSWMLETIHVIDRTTHKGYQKSIDHYPEKGRIINTVWSDVFTCNYCESEYIFFDVAVDSATGKIKDNYHCPSCGVLLNKKESKRRMTTFFDTATNQEVTQSKQVPVLIRYAVGKKRYEKQPDEEDLEILKKIDRMEIPFWFPIKEIPSVSQLPFITLVDRILSITIDEDYKQNPQKQAQVKVLENQIDIRIYRLYGLTYDKMEIVDPEIEKIISRKEYEQFQIH